MKTLLALSLALTGGSVAFHFQLPLPWLLGGLLSVITFKTVTGLTPQPSKAFAKIMRVLLGVALGQAVSLSFASYNEHVMWTAAFALIFVLVITYLGTVFFSKTLSFSDRDAFMSSLPGGLTFLMSFAEDLGKNFPKITIIHTSRMVSLVTVFSLFAYFEHQTIPVRSIFNEFHLPPSLQDLLSISILFLICYYVNNKWRIPGGDLILPMCISTAAYATHLVNASMPSIVITLAMATFGAVIGSKLAKSSFSTYHKAVSKSLTFTALSLGLAFLLAWFLSKIFGVHYLVFFLALAPGSIPEICLIAITLGLDVGLVASVHVCRYLFIMLIGSIGYRHFSLKNQCASAVKYSFKHNKPTKKALSARM